MKTNILVKLFFLLVISGFVSCGDMTDTFSEFIAGGETIYVGKADSVKSRGGRERIEVSWYLLSDPKVTGYKIFWNNKRDSISGSLVKTDNVDTVRVLMENMPEYVYNFDIFLYDNAGNSSIKSSVVGRSYGAFYEESLLNRTYTNIRRLSGTSNIVVNWANKSDEMIGVEFSYVDVSSNNVKLMIGKQNTDTVLNIPVQGSFQYRTAFKPEINALDTFYSKISQVTLTN